MLTLFAIFSINRSSLLLRRELDQEYQTLAEYRKTAGGRSPFRTFSTTSTTSSPTTPSTTSTTTTIATRSESVGGPYGEWYYKDLTDEVQGPFDSDLMLQWDNSGYFR